MVEETKVPDLTKFVVNVEPKLKRFLVSDTHFDHANIIKYQNRPFKSVSEMNYELVRRWNEAVQPNDVVYFLGDLTIGGGHQTCAYWLKRLNGNIVFINGNHHDRGIADYLVTHHEGRPYLLVHDPIDAPADYEGWIIHGHCHANHLDKYPLINPKYKTVNVCVELINYTPIEFDKVHEMVKHNQWVKTL